MVRQKLSSERRAALNSVKVVGISLVLLNSVFMPGAIVPDSGGGFGFFHLFLFMPIITAILGILMVLFSFVAFVQGIAALRAGPEEPVLAWMGIMSPIILLLMSSLIILGLLAFLVR